MTIRIKAIDDAVEHYDAPSVAAAAYTEIDRLQAKIERLREGLQWYAEAVVTELIIDGGRLADDLLKDELLKDGDT